MNHNEIVFNDFLEYLNLLSPIPERELLKLKKLCTLSQINKGDYFIRQGDNTTKFAFVSSGLFRFVYLSEDGKEFTKSFIDKKSFLTSYSSLLENRESFFSIEALEDSTLILIDFYAWKRLFEDEISWNKLYIKLLEKLYIQKEEREKEFLLYDAKERYEIFLEKFQNLDKRVKQYQIASYLGITSVALSNLRKELKN